MHRSGLTSIPVSAATRLASAFKSSGSGCTGRRSEEHTSELQPRLHLVCRLLLDKKKPSSRVPAPLTAPLAPPPSPSLILVCPRHRQRTRAFAPTSSHCCARQACSPSPRPRRRHA